MGFINLIIVAVDNMMSQIELIEKEDIMIRFQNLPSSVLGSPSNAHELNALSLRDISKSQ